MEFHAHGFSLAQPKPLREWTSSQKISFPLFSLHHYALQINKSFLKIAKGKYFNPVVNTSAGTQVLLAEYLGLGVEPPAGAEHGRQQEIQRGAVSLPPTWQACMEFPAPSLGPWLQAFGEWNSKWEHIPSLSLLCHSTFLKSLKSSNKYFLVLQKNVVTYFPLLFFIPSRSLPKLLSPAMPLTLMTLIKHDYLITINLLCYILHPPLTHLIPLCGWPLMVTKSKSSCSVQSGVDTCPGQKGRCRGPAYHVFLPCI